MDPELWSAVKEVLVDAEAVAVADRAAWLRERCAGDAALLAEVGSLLEEEDAAETFIEEPMIRLGSATEYAEAASEAALGRRIGPYELASKLGHGGMGTVYLAERREGFEQQVALKLLKRGMDTDEIVRRFEHERQILARLEHPHIARLLDGGSTDDGLPYFVLEHVEGAPIDTYCDTHRLSIGERLRLFLKVCSAVELAHRNLVVHRDLKPSNILVTADSEPKLLDFGIAKLLAEDGPDANLVTNAGQRPMTPAYASPEQILGEPVTTGSDVYSLGVLLYELLTGTRPYRLDSGSHEQLGRSITEQSPKRPSTAVRHLHVVGKGDQGSAADPAEVGRLRGTDPKQLRRRLRGDLDTIVLKAMEKDAEKRYATVEQLSADLRRHLDGQTILARPQTFTYRASRFLRRYWLATGAAVLGVVLLGWVAFSEARRARDLEARSKIEVVLGQALLGDDPYHPTEIRLEEIADEIRLNFADQPRSRADLLSKVASAYNRLRRYEQAHELYEEVLGIHTVELGERHPITNTTKASLGFALQRLHRLNEAEALLREALGYLAAAGDDYAGELINAQTYLGQTLQDAGRPKEAELLLQQVVAARRAAADSSSKQLFLATSLGNLGDVQLLLDLNEEALEVFNEALEIRQQLLKSPHPLIGRSFDKLAQAQMNLGNFELAKQHALQAYEIHYKTLGANHLDTATDLNNLGTIYKHFGRLEKATEAWNDALPVISAASDEKHAAILNNIAWATSALARESNNDPALFLEARNGFQKSLSLYDALEVRPPEASDVILNLAIAEFRLKNYSAAESKFLELLQQEERVYGKASHQAAEAHRNLASLYLRLGRFDEALEHSRPPFDRFSTEYDRGAAMSLHGYLLVKTGNIEEADSFLVDGYKLLADESHPDAQIFLDRARSRLIELYQATGRPAEAERLQATDS